MPQSGLIFSEGGLPGDAREYWVQDCSAASENILLAITAKGLGGVWTGAYPTNRSQEVHDALGLPDNIIPLNIILFGYPKDTPQRQVEARQHPLAEVVGKT